MFTVLMPIDGSETHGVAQADAVVALPHAADEVRVTLLHVFDEEELGDYYASADLFVSPSLSEPFGITITEALSAGTRVVATESGVNEVLPDDCVIEVEPASGSLADGIDYGLSLEGPPEYDPVTWEDVVDETIDFYERIAGE